MGLHGEFVGRGHEDLVQLPKHRGGLVPWADDRPGEQEVDGMQPDAQRRHDADVAASAADGPEKLGVVVLVHGGRAPVGEHEVGADEVVEGEVAEGESEAAALSSSTALLSAEVALPTFQQVEK
jgi:hypothetical protein